MAERMKKSTGKRNFNYPATTAGSKLARKLRAEGNKLSEAERKSLFNRGMQIIYGGSGTEETVRSR